ncbi:PREDICTED: LEAF RUST 10 DISEASE-RESISTANCE LOCUS RECEPTOR-LIKE PROTEIN KINASE-like 1.2 isoform X2 [Tarenaya hassleriana]|uniref:LEAF RUST 10 DISEASE-RESISTANCE LOCUS RECEPTOR-LIKE PROTEIN KINASE-like 1.2 isoform X2 n=1 Tax=Tarenaya hassleriana TaxID=28532 RepID=UPI00053C9BDA|nr:PREDICTED: LEAF RUST 10 DISEASE-RESISTANCE LOCUS RECEPTOR-LIKE PROTEIN KINASE-like 1.2 isoform X2 [Tarenaya hassleriana]
MVSNLMKHHLLFIFTFTIIPSSLAADRYYENCRETFRCGPPPSQMFENGTTYPFWGINKSGYCGRPGFELSCNNQNNLTLNLGNRTLRVLSANLTGQTITVADDSLFQGRCPETLDLSGIKQFELAASTTEKIDLFTCPDSPSPPSFPVPCTTRRGEKSTYYAFRTRDNNKSEGCTRVGEIALKRSVLESNLTSSLKEALELGFDLRYIMEDDSCRRCTDSSGVCGSELDSGRFQCLCADKPHKSSCHDGGGGINWKVKICIGVVAGFAGISATSAACYFYYRRKIRRYRTSSVLLPKNITSEPSSKNSDMEKAEELLAGVRVFTYEELEEATNNFDPSKELGDGGFGTVYYGQLKDGRSVAVKRLYENNYKRVEQFRNEVEILARLRHPNLVTLFGCSSKHSRDLLLVYEFIPNGTLADHLHGPRANPSALPWSTRLKIAAETANALKYLHASEIIHRDVKSNNILLDRNFNVKVADFGLSRLFPMDRTHVSTSPQGTPGYLDPDYHQCYQLTSKSDVFSFGVVLMELISSMPAVDITRHRHEINLSKMAIVKIQSHSLHEMVDSTLGFETDAKVRDSVSSVAELAFQCLQSDKDLRPDISQVLETLTRIRNDGFDLERADEIIDVGVANDDDDDDGAVMMKSGQLVTSSPNTVMVKWDSSKE